MKKKRRLKKKVKLALVIILLCISLSVLIGTTYALWLSTFHQKDANVISTGCFETTFKEMSSSIDLSNTYPVNDEKGLKSTPYVFKIKNVCDNKAKFQVTLNTLQKTGNKIPDELIKYVFYESNENADTGSLLSGADKNEETKDIHTTLPIINSYIMKEDILGANEEKEYALKLWISDTATTSINGYYFESSINLTAVPID